MNNEYLLLEFSYEWNLQKTVYRLDHGNHTNTFRENGRFYRLRNVSVATIFTNGNYQISVTIRLTFIRCRLRISLLTTPQIMMSLPKPSFKNWLIVDLCTCENCRWDAFRLEIRVGLWAKHPLLYYIMFFAKPTIILFIYGFDTAHSSLYLIRVGWAMQLRQCDLKQKRLAKYFKCKWSCSYISCISILHSFVCNPMTISFQI